MWTPLDLQTRNREMERFSDRIEQAHRGERVGSGDAGPRPLARAAGLIARVSRALRLATPRHAATR